MNKNRNTIQLLLLFVFLSVTNSMMLSKKYLKHKHKIRKINNFHLSNVKFRRNFPQERNLAEIAESKRPETVDSLTSANDYMVNPNL